MEFLVEFMTKNPSLGSTLMIMGLLRAVFKPIQGVIQSYVDATEDTSDNEKWEAMKEAKWFKALSWLLDYTASIKIPK